MLLALFLLQAAAAPQPDIEFQAHVEAKSVTIQKQGDASLTLRTDPDGGNVVKVAAPKANGRKTIKNVQVDIHAQANIAAPQQNESAQETPVPQ